MKAHPDPLPIRPRPDGPSTLPKRAAMSDSSDPLPTLRLCRADHASALIPKRLALPLREQAYSAAQALPDGDPDRCCQSLRLGLLLG